VSEPRVASFGCGYVGECREPRFVPTVRSGPVASGITAGTLMAFEAQNVDEPSARTTKKAS